VKAVRGLAGAKAHLGHLAFWDSHIGILFNFKLIERAPRVRFLSEGCIGGFGF
jgi:hypothetical protein